MTSAISFWNRYPLSLVTIQLRDFYIFLGSPYVVVIYVWPLSLGGGGNVIQDAAAHPDAGSLLSAVMHCISGWHLLPTQLFCPNPNGKAGNWSHFDHREFGGEIP